MWVCFCIYRTSFRPDSLSETERDISRSVVSCLKEDQFFFNSRTPSDSTQKENKYPEIHPANAFIGNYLRLDLLDRYGYHDELYDNIKGYFEYMADRTGTLWELVSDNASCNHGFASHVIHWMKSLDMVR